MYKPMLYYYAWSLIHPRFLDDVSWSLMDLMHFVYYAAALQRLLVCSYAIVAIVALQPKPLIMLLASSERLS